MRLATTYMGMDLKNPLVVSASPLSKDVDMAKKLEDEGASAIVMYSLFEEEIYHEDDELDFYLSHGSESFAESLSYFPDSHNFLKGPEAYLNQLRLLKESVNIPVLGSLNGISKGGWIEKAKLIQEAGADGLELNVYYLSTEFHESDDYVNQIHIDILTEIKNKVNIPVAVKIGQNIGALPNFAKRLENAGADALVMFNRFYQPDIDLEKLEINPSLHLSTSNEILMPLRWIAVLWKKVNMSLAATSGVHAVEDVLKLTMAGADVTMMASSLLKYGPSHISTLLKGINEWMDTNEYDSLTQMRGSMSMKNVSDPEAFMRANYIKILQNYR
ncbi:MAG: dihydroorotate dehydrogenase-like protein [Fidelibacterota bacterium]